MNCSLPPVLTLPLIPQVVYVNKLSQIEVNLAQWLDQQLDARKHALRRYGLSEDTLLSYFNGDSYAQAISLLVLQDEGKGEASSRRQLFGIGKDSEITAQDVQWLKAWAVEHGFTYSMCGALLTTWGTSGACKAQSFRQPVHRPQDLLESNFALSISAALRDSSKTAGDLRTALAALASLAFRSEARQTDGLYMQLWRAALSCLSIGLLENKLSKRLRPWLKALMPALMCLLLLLALCTEKWEAHQSPPPEPLAHAQSNMIWTPLLLVAACLGSLRPGLFKRRLGKVLWWLLLMGGLGLLLTEVWLQLGWYSIKHVGLQPFTMPGFLPLKDFCDDWESRKKKVGWCQREITPLMQRYFATAFSEPFNARGSTLMASLFISVLQGRLIKVYWGLWLFSTLHGGALDGLFCAPAATRGTGTKPAGPASCCSGWLASAAM